MSIREFLLERIAEDEAQAKVGIELGWGPASKYGVPALQPDRVLAECDAKRAIVGEHDLDDSSTGDYCETCADWWKSELGEGPPGVAWPCPTLRAVAAVYSEHSDYQQEWEPNRG